MTTCSRYRGRDLCWLLRTRREQLGEKPFLVWAPFDGDTRTLSYEGFVGQVECLAEGLRALGLEQGDRVVLHMDNCPEVVLLWYACALGGFVAVTTNTAASSDEFRYFLEKTGPALIVTQESHRSVVQPHEASAPFALYVPDEERVHQGANSLRDGRSGELTWEMLLDTCAPGDVRAPDPMLPVGIQFTSGTSSRPKAVVWTHANALWGGEMSARHQGLMAEDRYLTMLPFFHTNAQSYSILASLWAGATVILQPRFSVSRFWSTALEHRCTRTSMVPFVFRALHSVAVPESHAFKTWGLGVAHPPAEDRFGVRILGWWGMTETVTQAIFTDPGFARPFMSMGWVAPEYAMRVARPDGLDCDFREIGRLLINGVRGESLFLEYLDDPEATASAFVDGDWLDTGDLVSVGPNGDVYFDSRASDIIKTGGENVSPGEIERVIASMPEVAEVAVVARSDQMLDQVPVAFVIAQPPGCPNLDQRVQEVCRARLSRFKVPRAVRVVDDLPRSALGKAAKGELRVLAERLVRDGS